MIEFKYTLTIPHGELILNRRILLLLILTVSMCLSLSDTVFPAVDRSLSEKVSELIRAQVEENNRGAAITLAGEPIYTSKMLARFYIRQNFLPAWSKDYGLLEQAEKLLKTIKEVNRQGLVPEYYHMEAIENLLQLTRAENREKVEPNMLAELDLLLTDAFLMMGCHFSVGCVNPVSTDADWFNLRSDLDVDRVLEEALEKNHINEMLLGLLPSQDDYTKLAQELANYREIADSGGWPPVSGGPKLKKGIEDSRVIELRRRLAVTRDLPQEGKKDVPLFDEELEQAVLNFQRRHGLTADGVVGPSTLSALNIAAEERVRQIEVNMERTRWISGNLGSRYIRINIADFRLDVIDNSRTVMTMAVVVGKRYWHTPVLSEKMTYLVLNPYWNVPKSIAAQEILPAIRKSPDYLAEHDMKILSGSWKDTEEINPLSINWDTITGNNFPYRIRQKPGPKNPLGRIKFMFPNKFNVYLHDTPSKHLFSRNVRAFSHGCIRIEQPLSLAEYLMLSDMRWTREKIEAEVKTGIEKAVPLPEPISVHVLYLTAWVDEQGIMQFRDDVYKRDTRLYEALRKKPARPKASLK